MYTELVVLLSEHGHGLLAVTIWSMVVVFVVALPRYGRGTAAATSQPVAVLPQ